MTETKYLSGREYAALLSLFAAISHHAELFPVLKKRAQMVPGLWEKMETVETATSELLDGLLSTIPGDKLKHIKTDISHVKLYIKVEPPGCVPSVDMRGMSYVPTKALNELMCYVMEHECMLCDKTPVESRCCPVRSMFDNALPHEVAALDTEHCRYSDMSIGTEETE